MDLRLITRILSVRAKLKPSGCYRPCLSGVASFGEMGSPESRGT